MAKRTFKIVPLHNQYHISVLSFILLNIIIKSILTSVINDEQHFTKPDYCIKINSSSGCDCYTDYELFRISCLTNKVQIKGLISSQYLEINCNNMTRKDYDMPNMEFGTEFHIVEIKNCPLPEKASIAVYFKKFGISNVTSLWYNSKNLGINLKRSHLIGLQELENLQLKLQNPGNFPEDLFQDLGHLSHLEINADINDLPKGLLAPLKNIEFLDLSDNNISILIPGLFRSQQKLLELNLQRNKLQNLPENAFEGLSNLQTLDLKENIIENLESNLFDSLSDLKGISLNSNRLEKLPEGLFSYTKNLIFFTLINNSFALSGIPNGLFSNLPSLKTIHLSCDLKSIPEDTFINSKNIENIDLGGNNFTALPKILFKDQENILTISLIKNRLTELPKNIFKYNINLTMLLLSRNLLKKLPETLFHNQKKLIELDLSNNRLIELPENLFQNNKELNVLNISNNQLMKLSGYIFNSFESSLEVLNLSNNQLTDVNFIEFKKFRSLKILELQNNLIEIDEDKGFRLSTLKNAEVINLRNNSVIEALNLSKYLKALKTFDLSYNKISELDSSFLQYSTNDVLIVNLTYNQIKMIDFSNLTAVNDHKVENQLSIDLNNNPLNCDCKLIKFLQSLDDTYGSIFPRNIKIFADNLTCQEPENLKNKLLIDVFPMELLCPMDYDECSMNCRCFERTFDLAYIVDCSNRNMTTIPKLLSAKYFKLNKTELNMSNNILFQLPTMNNNNFTEVTKLLLFNNSLSDLSLENLPPNLTHFDLRFNKLKFLDNKILNYFNQSSTLQTLKLSGNPWLCDCKASQLLQYVHSHYEKLNDLKNMSCSTPLDGKIFQDLLLTDICPMDQRIIFLLSMLAVFFFLIILLTIIYLKYEIEIKVYLYARNMCLCLVNEEEEENKLYDAFISYSSKDENFVAEYLVPNLENGTPSFKICVHYRDFIVGENIGDNISFAIENSRRTIVVLSKNFLNSNWAREEFRLAHVLALQERKPKIIIILFDDIENNEDLDPELKVYLKTNTYLSKDDPWFWERLRYAMPHSTLNRNGYSKNFNIDDCSVDNELELINSPTFSFNSNSQETDV